MRMMLMRRKVISVPKLWVSRTIVTIPELKFKSMSCYFELSFCLGAASAWPNTALGSHMLSHGPILTRSIRYR